MLFKACMKFDNDCFILSVLYNNYLLYASIINILLRLCLWYSNALSAIYSPTVLSY
jgi:hypothetical protein